MTCVISGMMMKHGSGICGEEGDTTSLLEEETF